MSSSTRNANKRKTVLIVTYYWPPSGGAGVQRFLKFVKYFPEHGIDPVVLTCANPTYPILDHTLADDIPEHVPVFKARTLEPFSLYGRFSGTSPEAAANPTTILGARELNPQQRLARWLRANLFVPDARVGWVPFARSRAQAIIKEHNIDTVVTTGPPHSTHFIGKWLKRKTGIRWIADFRDPWTDIHYNRALPRTAFTRRRDEKMEISVLNDADDVTVTAPGTARYFERKVSRTYHTIPNGFDPDDFAQPEEKTDSKSESKSGSGSKSKSGSHADADIQQDTRPLLIRHVGSITETSVPDGLLRVLRQFPENAVRMEFIGTVHSGVQKLADELKLHDRVHIRPYVPHKNATMLMQQAGLNVVVVHRSEDSRILIPGKLYDYLNAGKPVLVIGPPDGNTASIVKNCGVGRAFDYDDEAGINEWIRDILNGIPVITPDPNQITRYARTNLAKRYAELIHGNIITDSDTF